MSGERGDRRPPYTLYYVLKCLRARLRIDRPSGSSLNYDMTARGKRSLAVDLKRKEGAEVVRRLAKERDVIVEPFRRGEA